MNSLFKWLLFIFLITCCADPRVDGARERCGSVEHTTCEYVYSDGSYTERITVETGEGGDVKVTIDEHYGDGWGQHGDVPSGPLTIELPDLDGGGEISFEPGDDTTPHHPDVDIPPEDSKVPLPEADSDNAWGFLDDQLARLEVSADSFEAMAEREIDATRSYSFEARGIGNLLLEVTGLNHHKRKEIKKKRRKIRHAKNLLIQARELTQDNAEVTQKLADEIRGLAGSSQNLETANLTKKIGESYNETVLGGFEHLRDSLEELDEVPKPKTVVQTPGEKRVQKARDYLEYAKENAPQGVITDRLLGASEVVLDKALESYNQGDAEIGDLLQEVSLTLTDIALSLTPGVGWGKDIYEAFTGRNLVSDEELSDVERGIAVFGVVTAGVGSKIGRAAKIFKAMRAGAWKSKTLGRAVDIAESATKFGATTKAGFDKFMEIAKQPFFKDPQAGSINISLLNDAIDKGKDVLKGWRKNHTITGMEDASVVNKRFIDDGWEGPYKDGTKVFSFTTKNEGNWVRVHGSASKPEGGWLMKEEAIRGLTPAQIQNKFSLPATPTHITDVRVPANTPMNRGKVAENFGGGEGAVQYHLQTRLDSQYYTNTRPL